MHPLSKSRVMALRQCPRRLWLEVHHPELRQDSPLAAMVMRNGRRLGRIARLIYAPGVDSVTIDRDHVGGEDAETQTRAALARGVPVFEACLRGARMQVFVDALLPVDSPPGQTRWRLVEIKSTTSVRSHFGDDVAIQVHVARAAGIELVSAAVATVDSRWCYPGSGDYKGLLVESDLSPVAFAADEPVGDWIAQASAIADAPDEPIRATGRHCRRPHECGFLAHCRSGEAQARFPVQWLPQVQTKRLRSHLADPSCRDLRDVPDELLDPLQQRVKRHTITGTTYFDADGARAALEPHPLPAAFLDFESIAPAIPVWAGTRPYQQIPFQFSLHRLGADGSESHEAFLDLSGDDPRPAIAHALVGACADSGPVFVWNRSFESRCLRDLAVAVPALASPLRALDARLVDLLPIVRRHWYAPSQRGSWSIKDVLPSMPGGIDYGTLDGVHSGSEAQEAWLEAVDPATTESRRAAIEASLLDYCRLDTAAMVHVWRVLGGETRA